MSASQNADTGFDSYREDWRSVARYTVRYQGLFFENLSHVKNTIATGRTYDEAIDLEVRERKTLDAQGIKGHILLDLECPEETRLAYMKVRAARQARENSLVLRETEAIAT